MAVAKRSYGISSAAAAGSSTIRLSQGKSPPVRLDAADTGRVASITESGGGRRRGWGTAGLVAAWRYSLLLKTG